jgi:hypothetical protein
LANQRQFKKNILEKLNWKIRSIFQERQNQLFR